MKHFDFKSQTLGQTAPNYFAIMVLLIVYASIVSTIIANSTVDFSQCKTEIVMIGLISLALFWVAQLKCFFALFFWDEKGIWQTHLIIPGKKYITWQERKY